MNAAIQAALAAAKAAKTDKDAAIPEVDVSGGAVLLFLLVLFSVGASIAALVMFA